MTNKEKFLALVTEHDSSTLEAVRERNNNRARVRESQNIAIKVLIRLDELEWTQRHLAKEMDVLPQQITKIVSGKENLTLDTIVKLQQILNIPLLASFYEKTEKSDTDFSEQTVEYPILQSLVAESEAIIKYPTHESTMSVVYNKFHDKDVA